MWFLLRLCASVCARLVARRSVCSLGARVYGCVSLFASVSLGIARCIGDVRVSEDICFFLRPCVRVGVSVLHCLSVHSAECRLVYSCCARVWRYMPRIASVHARAFPFCWASW